MLLNNQGQRLLAFHFIQPLAVLSAAASNDLSRLGTELQQLASQFKVA